MSSTVKFEPEGLFVYTWDGDQKKTIRHPPNPKRIFTHLRDACEIVDGTTLGDIFKAVDALPRLKKFIAQYSWCRAIDQFHAQAQEPMRSEDNNPMDYLEIGFDIELHRFKTTVVDGKPKEWITTIDESPDFVGIGPPPEGEAHCNRPEGKTSYSVSYTPMYDLVDLPVKLNKEIVILEPWDKKLGNKRKELVRATREFVLLEVLDCIYWDISFHGGPADNADFVEEMKRRVEEIDSGEAKLIPMEDVWKDLGLDDEDEDDE